MEKRGKIILFDGVCNLCNNAVLFIIKKDKKNYFRFTSLQSETGKELLLKYGKDFSKTDTVILIDVDKEKYYEKSTAALHIAKNLSGIYPLFYGFIILPRFIRDKLYDFVAKNRYKWYGKKESCMIPTPELKEKFL